jgi:hypothetical protein
LRAAGFGVDRLVELSGVPSGTLRALLYGDRHAGLPVRRVRRATATKLLSIDVASAGRAPHALTDGAGTHRRLRALLDAGWSLPALAAELGRTPSSLRATLSRQRVTVATKMKVQGLHRWAFTADDPLTSPGTAGEDAGVTNPPQHDVDEVAVQRAMGGECLSLNVAELDLAVRRLSDRGVPIRRIAVLLGISARTVARRRVTTTR